MSAMKEYLPIVETPDANHLKIEVRYQLGGVNYATYRNEARGYYLSVTPVNRYISSGLPCESFVCFTGVKKLILPCSRRSEKKMEQAVGLAQEQKAELIKHVLQENSLQLLEATQEVS